MEKEEKKSFVKRLREVLHKEITPKRFYLVVAVVAVLLVVAVYTSYAVFSVSYEKKNVLNIVTGNLNTSMTVMGESKPRRMMSARSMRTVETNSKYVLSVQANTTRTFEVTLNNINSIEAKFLLYYLGTLQDGVEVGYLKGTEAPPTNDGVTLKKYEDSNSKKTYYIVVKNTTDESVSVTLGNSVGLAGKALDLPAGAHFITKSLDAPNAVTTLLEKEGTTSEELKSFSHTAGSSQSGWTKEELTDYRYVGTNPNNYVTFNDELWRIVGVFYQETETGEKVQQLKLVRNTSIGAYAWDNTSVETAFGKNRWTDATLMKLLNPGYQEEGGSLYFEANRGTCFVGQNGATTPCDFVASGLSPLSQTLIDDALFYLGGSSQTSGNASSYYVSERGNNLFSSSFYPREDRFRGKVGLLYPSDYAYSVNEEGSWLLKGDARSYWFLTARSDVSDQVYTLDESGNISSNYGYAASEVLPVVYLKPYINITSGTGSIDDPYLLA